MQEKTGQIVRILNHALTIQGASTELARKIVDNFAYITAPERPSIDLGLVRAFAGGSGGGRSTKPGNVVLNMRKLVVAIASGALTLVGATAAPWMLLLGGLVVWESLWSAAEIQLGESEAAVLWAMWISRDKDNNTVRKAEVAEVVNSELGKCGKPALAQADIETALSRLKTIDCIAIAEDHPDSYWLREWVQISYH